MAPPDSRREVGGLVWAKADSISHDFNRTFGARHADKWLLGTVLEAYKTKKNANSKRTTTYVTASYKVGDITKEKLLSLQTLQPQDPTVVAAAPAPLAPPDNSDATNVGGTNNNETPPPPPTTTTPATAAAAAATTAATGGDPTDGDALPQPPPVGPPEVTSTHDRKWYDGNNIHSQINGPSLGKHWKFLGRRILSWL